MLRLPLAILAAISTLTFGTLAAPQADGTQNTAALRSQVQAITDKSPSPAVKKSVRAFLKRASTSELQAFAAGKSSVPLADLSLAEMQPKPILIGQESCKPKGCKVTLICKPKKDNPCESGDTVIACDVPC
jgi:hypothetical protein